MNEFPEQENNFNYLFSFTPKTGNSSWSLNLGKQELIDNNFYIPSFKQTIQSGSNSVEIENEYLFLKPTGENSIDVYQNEYLQNEILDDQYVKINKLTGEGLVGSTGFGKSLKCKNEMLVVGDANCNNNAGAIFIFDLYNSQGIGATGNLNWGQDLIVSGSQPSGLYGKQVDLIKDNTDYLIATSATAENNSGAVYIYDNQGLTLSKKINPEQDVNNFGKSLSMLKIENLFYVLVGQDKNSTGSISIYKESSQGLRDFYYAGSIDSPYPQSGNMFAQAIESNDSSFIVSAPRQDNSGACYYYKYNQSSGVFTKVQDIIPNDLSAQDKFGSNITYDGSHAVLTSEQGSGKAYIYEKTNDNFNLMSNITGDFGEDTSEYTNAVVDGYTIILGSIDNSETYYFSTGASYNQTQTGISLSGVGGKLYDNNGHFLYGYNTEEKTNLSGNVFSGYQSIFINNHLYNSKDNIGTGLDKFNGWSMAGTENLKSYYLSIANVST